MAERSVVAAPRAGRRAAHVQLVGLLHADGAAVRPNLAVLPLRIHERSRRRPDLSDRRTPQWADGRAALRPDGVCRVQGAVRSHAAAATEIAGRAPASTGVHVLRRRRLMRYRLPLLILVLLFVSAALAAGAGPGDSARALPSPP